MSERPVIIKAYGRSVALGKEDTFTCSDYDVAIRVANELATLTGIRRKVKLHPGGRHGFRRWGVEAH